MRISIFDKKENMRFNKERRGNVKNWEKHDWWGYRWWGGHIQKMGTITRFTEKFVHPYMRGRYDHDILELACGGGRFSVELVRYARSLDVMDMNKACLKICKKRLMYYPIEVRYYLNDGISCDVLKDNKYSFIACYDAMVHMHPDIIETYVAQLSNHLSVGGIMWLDHSGKGAREFGHRTDMTPVKMAEYGERYGLGIIAQVFRNEHDCISIMGRAEVAQDEQRGTREEVKTI